MKKHGLKMQIHHLMEESDGQERLLYEIRQNCSQYLSNPTTLYRGTNRCSTVAKIPIRTDRRALSGLVLGAVMFNDMIERSLNIPNIRNACHFASNAWKVASEYGGVCFLFPVNGSNIVLNDFVQDSFSILEDLETTFEANIMHVDGDVRSQIDNLDPRHKQAYDSIIDEFSFGVGRGYKVYKPNSIPKFQEGIIVEAMVTGATHTYAINARYAQKLLGINNKGNTYLDVITTELFDQLISHIKD